MSIIARHSNCMVCCWSFWHFDKRSINGSANKHIFRKFAYIDIDNHALMHFCMLQIALDILRQKILTKITRILRNLVHEHSVHFHNTDFLDHSLVLNCIAFIWYLSCPQPTQHFCTNTTKPLLFGYNLPCMAQYGVNIWSNEIVIARILEVWSVMRICTMGLSTGEQLLQWNALG